jgi:hypothetical protein
MHAFKINKRIQYKLQKHSAIHKTIFTKANKIKSRRQANPLRGHSSFRYPNQQSTLSKLLMDYF